MNIDGSIQPNWVLGTLAPQERQRLAPHFREVPLELGATLHSQGTPPSNMIFPIRGIVSLLLSLKSGAMGEIGIVGSEGLVGVSICLGGATVTHEAVVQAEGRAVVLPASIAREEFDRNGNFQRSVLKYAQVLLSQTSQTALCNRHHSIEQQFARWLLLSIDRLASDEVVMTQGLIANMLGVRREGVTMAAGKLQKDGVISYKRGQIKVVNRPALVDIACECYSEIATVYKDMGMTRSSV